MEIQQKTWYKILRHGMPPEDITESNYPLTATLLMEHADVIPKKLKDTFNQELINEFYFYGEDFDKYKDELAGKDTTCTEMNIYLSDGLTVAVKIAKLY